MTVASPGLPGQVDSLFGSRRFDAVVIGASAGGVEALSLLLPSLPSTFEAAVVVVLHLPPGRPSLLVDIFSRKCALPVMEAADKEPVVVGTVYFAPPDYHLLVDAGPQFAMSVDELVNYSRPAIDPLFESAADLYGDRLLGIVLTGASHDGAAGLQAVLARGGVGIVQEPSTAKMPLMPQAAASRSPSALVMTLEQMAGVLAGLDRSGPAVTSATGVATFRN